MVHVSLFEVPVDNTLLVRATVIIASSVTREVHWPFFSGHPWGPRGAGSGEVTVNLGVGSGVVVPLISAVEGETDETNKSSIIMLNHVVGDPGTGWAHGESSP